MTEIMQVKENYEYKAVNMPNAKTGRFGVSIVASATSLVLARAKRQRRKLILDHTRVSMILRSTIFQTFARIARWLRSRQRTKGTFPLSHRQSA